MKRSRFTEEQIIGILKQVEAGVRLDFTRPGKPTDNGHIESFNGKVRDECLNQNVFCPWLTPGTALKGGDVIISGTTAQCAGLDEPGNVPAISSTVLPDRNH